ncbi:serine hydrolase domain-containing protein [Microbulbifer marinus]|uniref:CubicO group peptidase, beta-lactamase class C family n=1 Tax=Microbulbifer marinus TaxID=658218 RepID=A0A1H3ZEQ6_9GAMM|nr:serine hydrolase domain-containing protein [Microbulbifer marinus]SEA22160.1 CubicO group peptidase, beta-lactamase class C family [Microbulbifer marinus]
MRRIISFFSFLLLVNAAVHAAQNPPSPPIEDLQQLGEAIDQVRATTRVPGVAVALLLPSGEAWTHTSGKADIAANKPVIDQTRFRVGSISKLLVGLAVMKLQEDGRLSLNDKLSDLAPEIEYDNPWEETYPLRLVHLLNHSSGWDAPHFVEQVGRPGKPISIREALAIHPHSRTSRWAPGTRTAYNNTGPLVAAYVVEKVAGLPYEEYIQRNFFDPLQMGDSGYFYSDDYRSHAATLYRGAQALPYWHLNNRAAGGLHSSLRDMNSLARMLLQRGALGDRRVLSASAIAATERPQHTLAAQAGLQLSWGLGNNVFHHNGVVFHGHEGSLPGASAILAYQPELGVAHVVMANSNGPAVTEIHRLIADYVTRDTAPPSVNSERAFTEADQSLSGYYRVASPVSEATAFLTDLVPWQLSVNSQRATIRPLVGAPPRQLLGGAGITFKQNTTGKIALVKVEGPLDGEVLHYGPQTLKRTGAFSAYAPLLVTLLWAVSAAIALLFMLVWLPRYLFGRIERGAQLTLRVWPLLTVVAMLVALLGAKLAAGGPIPFVLAGRVSIPSLMVFVGTLAFLLSALWSLRVWFRHRNHGMNRLVKYHATLLIVLNLLVALYLLGHGVIGMRLWA